MMTYKETLFFIAKCLTITHDVPNRNSIEQELQSGTVDWDRVVQVSTQHYVYPALYCNLQRAEFLQYLPAELVAHMEHITDLNRERNQQIIAQATAINTLLLNNNITPIFLKGTANLLDNRYEDIAERMVGDIDFIVSEEVYIQTVNLLQKSEYTKVNQTNFDFPNFKHYPRLHKKECVAAIEIHKELLIERYASEFNYKLVKKNTIQTNGIHLMSHQNQLSLTIIASHINDNGVRYQQLSLRNGYDVFLLALKINPLKAIESFDKLFDPLHTFLAYAHNTFHTDVINYNETIKTKKALDSFKALLENQELRKKHLRKEQRKQHLRLRIQILLKSIYNASIRKWLFKRIIHGRQKP